MSSNVSYLKVKYIMKNNILISIKPIYVEKIISGQKIYEYRRKMPVTTIGIIAFYSTLPIQKVLAIADVVDKISDHPTKLWKITNKGGCISRDTFNNYFNGLCIAHAFKLDNIKTLIEALSLGAINASLLTPPQSFRYLNVQN
jgi:predicted transcriptional regulator